MGKKEGLLERSQDARKKVDAKRCQLLRHTDPSLGRGRAALQQFTATIRLFGVIARLNFVARLCACTAPSSHLLCFVFSRTGPHSSPFVAERSLQGQVEETEGHMRTEENREKTK